MIYAIILTSRGCSRPVPSLDSAVKSRYSSFEELRSENPRLYWMINNLCSQHWYRLSGNNYMFNVTSEFNPYLVIDNSWFMTAEQFKFFASQALHRESAKNVSLREYMQDMRFCTKTIYVSDGGGYVGYEVPEYVGGYLNGSYLGVYPDGSSCS